MSEENKISLGKKKKEKLQPGKMTKRTAASLFIILLLVPATILFAARYAEKSYYLVSVLIIFYTMAPFFLVFEKRKPQARELVLLAVMCAIAVFSRAIFIWLPHFKPLVAIVMITGVAFGAESGFLAGAVSGFVSNFLFGQGPWTPWQMFAFGIAGFLAGMCCRKGIISRRPVPLAVFGAAVVLLIVGPLLDTSTLFTMTAGMSKASAAAVYLSGLPVNAVHALATAVTLLLVSKAFFEKLDRVKRKYGMMEEEAL